MPGSTRESAASMSRGARNGGVVDGATVRPYILILMSEDDPSDPRLRAVVAGCREIARTDVLAMTMRGRCPPREYDGMTFIERLSMDGDASSGIAGAPVFRRATRLAERCRRAAVSGGRGLGPFVRRHCARAVGPGLAAVSAATRRYVVAEVLYRRARAVSIPPRIAVCHDVPTLLACVRLRSRYRCPVVYAGPAPGEGGDDQRGVIAHAGARLRSAIDRCLLRQADAVVSAPPEGLDTARFGAVVERVFAGGAARG